MPTMQRTFTPAFRATLGTFTLALCAAALAACATVAGTAAGAGVAAASGGNAETGALIGGATGALVDIF